MFKQVGTGPHPDPISPWATHGSVLSLGGPQGSRVRAGADFGQRPHG